MALYFAVRNVAAHAREMGGTTPAEPVFFLKPDASLVPPGELALPTDLGAIHFEAELAVRLDHRLARASPEEARRAIREVGVVLDLTARELQDARKKAGLPWLEPKGFDGACVLGPLVRAPEALGELEVSLQVGGVERQRFRVADYQVPPDALLARLSQRITLEPGDILGCGTGAGVGPLVQGDRLEAVLEGLDGTRFEAHVASGPA